MTEKPYFYPPKIVFRASLSTKLKHEEGNRAMKSSLLGSIFAFLIMLAIGSIFFFIGGTEIQEYYASESWSVTEGNITRLNIDEDYDSDDGYTYRAIVEYRFTALGCDYFGSRYQFGSDIYSSDRGRAERVVGSYSLGEDVLVYYNPENPEANVLTREVDWLLWFFFGIGVLLMVGALIILLWGIFSQFWGNRDATPKLKPLESDTEYLLENEKFKL